jgi:hypothetical protein
MDAFIGNRIDCNGGIIGCAIKYPLARELFAFAISELSVVNQSDLDSYFRGPPSVRKSSCKNFVDDYNATPSLEGKIARKKKMKSALGFGCVGGLLALINISRRAPEKNLLRNN